MTHRQRELLAVIQRYMAEHGGVAPSFDEMRAALGVASKSGIHRLLDELERQGRIRRAGRHARSIAIVAQEVDLTAIDDDQLLGECSRRGLLRGGA